MTPLCVLAVVSEIYPLIKTGGLADVAGALPAALAVEDVSVRSLVPGYPGVMSALADPTVVYRIDDLFGGAARVLAGQAAGLDLLVIDAPHLYTRVGDPYVGPNGASWPDNVFRFGALARVAAWIGQGLMTDYRPDIIHAHDWQAGLTPAYLHYSSASRPGTVMTVHNLAFQGQFPTGYLGALGLPPESYSIDGVEYYGSIGFLKAGLQLADRITTVSPTYALEICTPSGGMGMDGLLRARRDVLHGILNGIDTTVWDPGTDEHLMSCFDGDHLAARADNKAELQTRLGLAVDPDRLLFGVVSRLAAQKGIDLLIAAIPALVAQGGQLALLGSGDAALEARLRAAVAAHPGSVGVQLGYNEALAHLIQGGADALLVPSRFEPCGLTQLYALRYGTLPLVARVGGLSDTVIDANEVAIAAGVATGFQFLPGDVTMLLAAIERAFTVWRKPDLWRRLQRNAMRSDVSWHLPARRYAAMYREIVAERPPIERG